MSTVSLDQDLARELRSRGIRRGSGWRWLDQPGGEMRAFIDVQDVDGATLVLHAYTREGGNWGNRSPLAAEIEQLTAAQFIQHLIRKTIVSA